MLYGFDAPVYGPLAFGTSARSAVLTDWPGGGFIGIHGTNEPELLPGRVSHGCVRLTGARLDLLIGSGRVRSLPGRAHGHSEKHTSTGACSSFAAS